MIHTLALVLVFVLTTLAQAKLEPAHIFSDSMVLQRDLPVPVWGWADPGTEVTVVFSGQEKTAAASSSGRWEVKLDPLAASSSARAMVITGKAGESVTFNDILIGDVWICSGQSNMEWSVKASHNPAQEIAQGNHPMIRLFNVAGHEIAASRQAKLKHHVRWHKCSPQSLPDFSAVGYSFGRAIHQQSKVPIGLIGTNWGGTRIEPWTPAEGFRTQPELAAYSQAIDAQLPTTEPGKGLWSRYFQDMEAWNATCKEHLDQGIPFPPMPVAPGPRSAGEGGAIYNAMLAPIVGYGVRGAIWYQGESNAGDGLNYLPKLKALVEGWRSVWNQPDDFPFYFYVVKLAQFLQPNPNPAGGDTFTAIRIAQDRVCELPHTGVASAIDIGNPTDIHPKNKQDVGQRLARWALRDVYGQKDTVVSGPTLKGLAIAGNKAVISFNHLGGGLMKASKQGLAVPVETPDAELRGFAISGADKKWHWAKAQIVGESVEVSAAEVAQPVAVRYAYASNPGKVNLYNKAGLPAIPFASDVWMP